jgi:hypothetical protein
MLSQADRHQALMCSALPDWRATLAGHRQWKLLASVSARAAPWPAADDARPVVQSGGWRHGTPCRDVSGVSHRATHAGGMAASYEVGY